MSRGAPGVRHLNGALKARVERGFYLMHGQQMSDYNFSMMSGAEARGYIDFVRQHAAQSGQPEVVLTPAVAPVSDLVQVPVAPVYQMTEEASATPLSQMVDAIVSDRVEAVTEAPAVGRPRASRKRGFMIAGGIAAAAVISISGVWALGGGDKQQASRTTNDRASSLANQDKDGTEESEITQQPVMGEDTTQTEVASASGNITTTPPSTANRTITGARATAPVVTPPASSPAPVPTPEPTPVPAPTPPATEPVSGDGEPTLTPPASPAPIPDPPVAEPDPPATPDMQ